MYEILALTGYEIISHCLQNCLEHKCTEQRIQNFQVETDPKQKITKITLSSRIFQVPFKNLYWNNVYYEMCFRYMRPKKNCISVAHLR